MLRLVTVILISFFITSNIFASDKERIAELELALKETTAQDKLADIAYQLSILYQDSSLNQAVEYAQQSVNISKQINYTTRRLKAIHQLGDLFRLNKKYPKALEYHQQGLAIAKEYSNQKGIANAYLKIGKVYKDAGEYDKAKENYLNAIRIGEKIKNQLIIALANQALGELSYDLKKYNIATQFYIEALNNYLQTNNTYLQGIGFKNVGLMYRKVGEKEKSLEAFKNALKKFEEVDNKKELAEINFFLGEYYQSIKDFENAIVYMKNSLGFAELSGYHDYIKKGYENLATVYEKNKDYKNAYDYLKYYSAIKDTKFISELEAKIALEKKNKEIALINQNSQFKVKQERNRTYVLLSVSILILIFSIILYYNLRQKNKINKELELATRIANKSRQDKEEFFAYTSHEIRTPLNAVVGMAQLLGQTKLNEIQKKYLKTIKASAKNILFLVNDVLDLAKLEKGAIELEEIDTCLQDIVLEIEDSLSFKTRGKAVKLSTYIDPKIPDYVKGDPLRLNQILLNLTDNALKFTKEGEVKIELNLIEETDQSVRICFKVSDTGIGISPKQIEKIFESYQQASIDTTRNYGGTGLGLAITKQLIELMHSKIEIESQEGKGSVFKFNVVFPKSSTIKKKQIVIDTELEEIANVKILAVDDTALNRSIFYDLVYSKENNVQVELAEDGEKAIELCKKQKFDVILMDLQMPVLNGFETTERIRKDASNPNQKTPIIAMTAHVIAGVSSRCDAVGMNDYIAKPINVSLLFKKIKQYIPRLSKAPLPTEQTQTTKQSTPKIELQTNLVNLNDLLELLGGKHQKIVKYIDLFLKNVPKDLEQLKQYFEQKDWENTAKLAHKIKGNAGYMGIEKAKELLVEIEKLKEDVAILDKNNDIVKDLEEVLNKASNDLKQIKNNIIDLT